MNPLMQQLAAFKIGVVSAIYPKTCCARVRFDDLDGLETMPLYVLASKSHRDKSYAMPDLGEHVACLLDSNGETGVILGAIYSGADAPPVESEDKHHLRFEDGGSAEYDRSTGTLKVVTTGPVEVEAGGDASVTSAGNTTVAAGGDATVSAGDTIALRAPTVSIEADDVTVSKNLTVLETCTAKTFKPL